MKRLFTPSVGMRKTTPKKKATKDVIVLDADESNSTILDCEVMGKTNGLRNTHSASSDNLLTKPVSSLAAKYQSSSSYSTSKLSAALAKGLERLGAPKAGTSKPRDRTKGGILSDELADSVTTVAFEVLEGFFNSCRLPLLKVAVSTNQVTLSLANATNASNASRYVIFDSEIESIKYNMREEEQYGLIVVVTDACARRACSNMRLHSKGNGTRQFVVQVALESSRTSLQIDRLFSTLVHRLAETQMFAAQEISAETFRRALSQARAAADALEAARERDELERRRVAATLPVIKSSLLPPAVRTAFEPDSPKLQEKMPVILQKEVTATQLPAKDSSPSRPCTRLNTKEDLQDDGCGTCRFASGDSLTFPRAGRNSWTLTNADLTTLREGEFLNDGIINFYLKWLYHRVLPTRDRQRTHVFNSFFYSRLTRCMTSNSANRQSNGVSPSKFYNSSDNDQLSRGRVSMDCKFLPDADLEMTDQDQDDSETDETPSSSAMMQRKHASVRNWTRNVDIFDKDFILIPINVQSHWMIAIVCFAGLHKAAQTAKASSSLTSLKAAKSTCNSSPASKRTSASTSAPFTPTSSAGNNGKMTVRVVMTPVRKSKLTNVPAIKPLTAGGDQLALNGEGHRHGVDVDVCSGNGNGNGESPPPLSDMCKRLKEESLKSSAVLSQFASRTLDTYLPSQPPSAFDGTKQFMRDPETELDYEPTTVSQNEHQIVSIADSIGATRAVDSLTDVTHRNGSSLSGDEANRPASAGLELSRSAKQHFSDELETDSILDRNRQPCLILFDSLGRTHPKYGVARDIREYLQVEWDTRKASQCGAKTFASSDRSMQITTYFPVLPTQTNFYDCGLYALEYAERFFTKPIKELVKSPKRPNLDAWFADSKILNKRSHICEVIMELYEEEKRLRKAIT